MGGGKRTPQSYTSNTETPSGTGGDTSAATVSESENEDADENGTTVEASERFIEPSDEAQQQLDEIGADSGEGASEDESEVSAESEREEVETRVGTGAGASGDAIDEGSEPSGGTDSGVEVDRVEKGKFGELGVDPSASATEKAREYLSRSALAPRHSPHGSSPDGIDGGQRAIPPEEESSGRIGGWDEYDESEAASVSSLSDKVNTVGRTEKHMEVVELGVLAADDAGADSAFVTRYAEDYSSHDAPPKQCAQSQMTTYAFADAVGVEVPRHTYDTEGEWVAAEEVPGETVETIQAHDFPGRRVDPDEFRDRMAVQLLAGNSDLTPDNVKVDENGHVHCFDFDYARDTYSDFSDMEYWGALAKKTSDKLAQKNTNEPGEDEDMKFDREDFAERAQEIAVSIHNSGDTDRVVEAAAEYDERFADVNESQAEQIQNNIEIAVEHARQEQ